LITMQKPNFHIMYDTLPKNVLGLASMNKGLRKCAPSVE
jgi:hypothetical protein